MAIAATVVGTTVWAGAVSASETDQFLAWGIELADGSEQLNVFVNQEFEHALGRLEQSERELPCEKVPGRLYRRVFASMASSRLRRYVHRSEIEWYPRRGVNRWQYRSRSVFRHSTFSVFLPMARTVRIGEVYLGIDKLAHLFGIGRRYHGRYQRLLRRGLSPEEAQRRTIIWGFNVERTFLGGYTEGILSLADLEANFQGLRLAREMCEGEDHYLVRGEGGWRLSRPIDLRDYVNPAFDESYNSNQYFPHQWRWIKPILLAEYCSRFGHEQVQGRLAKYREIDTGSVARDVLAHHFQEEGRRPMERYGIDHLCTAEQQRSAHVSPVRERPPPEKDRVVDHGSSGSL